jgi:hypothetical protein
MLAAIGLLLAVATAANAHGGVATLQVGSERINPGGTLELLGDMTSEGSVEITLVADGDGSIRSLGTVQADQEGHFLVYLAIPADLPGGDCSIRARSEVEEAIVPIVVAGASVGGEEGQLPGQDEAFAGAPPSIGVAPLAGQSGAVTQPRSLAPAQPTPPANISLIVLAVGGALVAAFALGGFARRRGARRPGR